MQLKDLARRLPDDIWAIFEPILPARVWVGNGRPPASNRDCLHALLYVLASGIAWEFLPWCFPSYKTVQRRLADWLREDAFLRAWQLLAQRYEQLHGINWDQILLDGSKKPSKKGARRRGLLQSIAASRAVPFT
jgi:transposase